MPTFRYRAKDRAGNTVTGTVDADTESHAAGLIRERGQLPMDIRSAGSAAPAAMGEAGSVLVRYLIYPLWTGVNIRQLMFFFRQMTTLLGAGMSLSESLRSVQRRAGGRLGRIIAEMYDVTSRGGRLSDVVARYPRVFSSLQLSLIRVGEGGGLLDQMMDRIASYLEYEMKVRQMMSKVLFYPFLIMLGIMFIPHTPVLVLGSGRDFLLAVWRSSCVPLFAVVIGIFAAKLLFQFRTARLIWDATKIAPPVIGATARKIAMSRFCRALAVLYAAGMSMPESVLTAADACGNVYLAAGIKSAVPAIYAGEGLTSSLARTGAVSNIVLDMLGTGEKTGGADTMLQKVADYMDDEADASIHKMGVALFVLCILAAGIVVMIMLISSYTAIIAKEGLS